jgi:hypothetical protein
VVGASCTLNISFKHTTGDYLDAEHPLKPLEKSSPLKAKTKRNHQERKKNNEDQTHTRYITAQKQQKDLLAR